MSCFSGLIFDDGVRTLMCSTPSRAVIALTALFPNDDPEPNPKPCIMELNKELELLDGDIGRIYNLGLCIEPYVCNPPEGWILLECFTVD